MGKAKIHITQYLNGSAKADGKKFSLSEHNVQVRMIDTSKIVLQWSEGCPPNAVLAVLNYTGLNPKVYFVTLSTKQRPQQGNLQVVCVPGNGAPELRVDEL